MLPTKLHSHKPGNFGLPHNNIDPTNKNYSALYMYIYIQILLTKCFENQTCDLIYKKR